MAISDFSDMMIDTVTHEEFANRDAYGVKSYGSAASYSARVVYKNKLVRNADGNEVLATGMVWFLGTPNVDTEDRITLPDGSTPKILSVDRFPDGDGLHHTKVYFNG
jgi:hypothetical protein